MSHENMADFIARCIQSPGSPDLELQLLYFVWQLVENARRLESNGIMAWNFSAINFVIDDAWQLHLIEYGLMDLFQPVGLKSSAKGNFYAKMDLEGDDRKQALSVRSGLRSKIKKEVGGRTKIIQEYFNNCEKVRNPGQYMI